MKSRLHRGFRHGLGLLWGLLLASPTILAQAEPAQSGADGRPEIASQIDHLTKSLEQTQIELAQSRTEIQQLRSALQEVLARMNAIAPAPTTAAAPNGAQGSAAARQDAPPQSTPEEGHAKLAQISQDDWDILNERVDEQRQIKVESTSRYRLKLSGLALFNAFGNFGQVDRSDLPSIALPKIPGYSDGTVGASVRQSILGLTGIGPVLFGARTSADIQMDFLGGVPTGYGPTSSGVAEVRLARVRFDWKNTSAVAGLDYPFFSPNSPTTYMTVVVPGFASAGNLWTWTPTLRIEQRFSGSLSPFKLEAGFMDPSSNMDYVPNTNLRIASPTESSRQPTYGVRLSASTKSEDRQASIGLSGVYSPQRFLGNYSVSGWAGTLDWRIPLFPRTELTGEFFTGRGLDGFGGLPMSPLKPADPLYYAGVTAPELASLGVIGGWTQFKIKVDSRNEFNVAGGTGGRNSAGLRDAANSNSFLMSVPARNQMLFANYIFRPRSDLLFSAEYRRLRTYAVTGAPNSAGQIGLAVGFLF
jgi:hypothetical protein